MRAHPLEQASGHIAVEQQAGQPVLRRQVAHAADDGAVGEHDRQCQGQAAQDEQECQGNDERWQARLDDDVAVEPAQRHGTGEGEQDGGPQRPVEIDGRDGDHHAGKADHGTDRQVEFTGDHQQAGADGDDAQVGRHLHPVDDAIEVEHAGIAGRDDEEGKHEHRAGNRGELGAAKKPFDPAGRAHALVGGGNWLAGGAGRRRRIHAGAGQAGFERSHTMSFQ
ncbi:hypothetical protein D3C85_255600 [compost metagenome]